jgi:hypothetical protein
LFNTDVNNPGAYYKHVQRSASSVVFSDLCNLNRAVYLYVFSCISLFLCIIIHLARHQSLIHTEFCITRVAPKKSFMFIFYDSHTLSLHIMDTSLTKTLKKRNTCKKKQFPRQGFELQSSHSLSELVTAAPRRSYSNNAWIKSSHSKFRTSIAFRVCNPY